jgi:hypothetical protein
MLKLNSGKIFELGEYVSNFLHENGVTLESDLLVRLTKDDLKKVDEDLYYRNKPEGEEFTPSDENVIVNFDGFNIIFALQEEEDADEKGEA